MRLMEHLGNMPDISCAFGSSKHAVVVLGAVEPRTKYVGSNGEFHDLAAQFAAGTLGGLDGIACPNKFSRRSSQLYSSDPTMRRTRLFFAMSASRCGPPRLNPFQLHLARAFALHSCSSASGEPTTNPKSHNTWTSYRVLFSAAQPEPEPLSEYALPDV
jgi:hypothetical protein